MSLTKIGSIGINTGIQLAGVTTVSTLKIGSGVTVSSDGDIFATGVCTATSFVGDGTNLTNVNLVSDTSPQLGANLETNDQNIVFGDSSSSTTNRATFGAGTDLSIYHDGTDNFIQSTGKLYISSNTFVDIRSHEDETMIKGTPNGAVELYENNTKRFETTSIGNQVTGQLVVPDGGNNSGNNNVTFGSDNDCHVYHNGTDFFIVNTTGKLDLRAKAGEKSIVANPDGSVELYEDNTKRFETFDGGAKFIGHLRGDDNNRLQLGDSQALQIWNTSTNSYIRNAATNLFIDAQTAGDDIYITNNAQSDYMAKFKGAGAVELYYDNSLKLHTVNAGVEIEGNLQVDGSGTSVTIQPTDGLVNFGMDGRSSFVTGTNACYIFSGSGAGGDMPAGDLIIQSRSDQNRTIRFVAGSSPAQKASINQYGLCFGTDSAEANALDDYEEGEYTPSVSSGQTLNSSYDKLRYTKIGRKVSITGMLVFAGYDSSSYDANLTIGLPFNNGNGSDRSEYVFQAGIAYFNPSGTNSPNGNYNPIGFYISDNSSTAKLIALHPNNDTTIGDWVGSGSDIWLNLTYFI